MIIISKPYVESDSVKSYLKAVIHDEGRNKAYLIWYSVENEYRDFLCWENADAFLLLSLVVAIRSHQDIKVKAPVSGKLLFNLENYVMPLFIKIIPEGRTISIEADEISTIRFNAPGVGCGCSLGVDSLCSFYTHFGEATMDDYRVTHLAIFNSGHFGYLDQNEAEMAFIKGIEDIRPFSEEVGLPIIAVNTNLNEFFLGSFFHNLMSRIIPSTISCVLALQKLFGKYVFASSNSVDEFTIKPLDHTIAEAAFVPELSTESVEVILSGSSMNRVEKTDFIRGNPLTSKYLNVCWADQRANGAWHDRRYLEGKKRINCGWCPKCLRTLYTLELLGEDLSKYNALFDLDKYYEHRQEFIENVYLFRHKDELYWEIYELMKSKKQDKFPFRIYFKEFVIKLQRLSEQVGLQSLYKRMKKICRKVIMKCIPRK